MATEIERRFLLEALPPEWTANCERIQQGYLLAEEGRVLRVRKYGEHHIMTVKYGSGLSREEHEQDIPAALFDMLWPLTEGRRNDKLRYRHAQDGHIFEIDVFADNLAQLIILEIEFASEAEARAFTPPGAAGREVTLDHRYSNAYMALHGLPDDFQP